MNNYQSICHLLSWLITALLKTQKGCKMSMAVSVFHYKTVLSCKQFKPQKYSLYLMEDQKKKVGTIKCFTLLHDKWQLMHYQNFYQNYYLSTNYSYWLILFQALFFFYSLISVMNNWFLLPWEILDCRNHRMDWTYIQHCSLTTLFPFVHHCLIKQKRYKFCVGSCLECDLCHFCKGKWLFYSFSPCLCHQTLMLPPAR